MPYITEHRKKSMEPEIYNLSILIENKGDLNYAICELVARIITQTGVNYTNMSEKIDAVHDAETELRRRLLNPYEDMKIKENGDVPSFETALKIMGDYNG